MTHLDGNVLAGPASGLLGFDATTALGQCDACGDVMELGQARVYGVPMGYVARCRSCDSVLVVIVERVGQRTLSTRGLRWIREGAS
jgi:hypothetical protein